MSGQEIADCYALIAAKRLAEALTLDHIRHMYEHTSGTRGSKVSADGVDVVMTYHQEFPVDIPDSIALDDVEKTTPYIVDATDALVRAISGNIEGRSILVTRRLPAFLPGDILEGRVPGFGVRVVLRFDPQTLATTVTLHCLYGAA